MQYDRSQAKIKTAPIYNAFCNFFKKNSFNANNAKQIALADKMRAKTIISSGSAKREIILKI